jgi:hypothetical protein
MRTADVRENGLWLTFRGAAMLSDGLVLVKSPTNDLCRIVVWLTVGLWRAGEQNYDKSVRIACRSALIDVL